MTFKNGYDGDVDQELLQPTDMRMFAIACAFQRGYSVDKIWEMTKIDKWFLTRLFKIYNMEKTIAYVVEIHRQTLRSLCPLERTTLAPSH